MEDSSCHQMDVDRECEERPIFYVDNTGQLRGPFPLFLLIVWYRKGFFTSSTEFKMGDTKRSLASLMCENGVHNPFVPDEQEKELRRLEKQIRKMVITDQVTEEDVKTASMDYRNAVTSMFE